MLDLRRAFCIGGSLVLAGACGGKVEGITTDAAAIDSSRSGDDVLPSTPAGCPTTMPTGGPCTSTQGPESREHFYCHYFTSGATCPIEWKCTEKGTSALTFIGGGGGSCTLKVDDCNDGKPCGVVFETSGACIVECKRVCRCDAPTGKLTCTSIACGPGK
jgi:hypothetical protein